MYVVRINYGVDDEHNRVEVHQETIPDGRIMDQNLLNLFFDVKLQWGFNNDFDLKKKITLVLWEQTFSVVLLFTFHYNNADILVHKNFLFSNHMKTGFCSLFSQIQNWIIFSAIIFHYYYYYFIDKNVPTLPAKMKWVLTFISKKVHSTQWLEANDLTILSQGFVNLQINYCVEHKWW